MGYSGNRPAGCSATGLPPGLQIDALTCVISGTAPVLGPNSALFNTTVNANGVSGQPVQFTILNNALDYQGVSQTLYGGDRVNLVPRKIGFNGHSPQCAASGLPPGLTIDANTCAISGTLPMLPGAGQIFNTAVRSVGMAPLNLQFTVISSAILYPKLSVYTVGDQVSLVPRIIGFNNGSAVNCTATGMPPGLYLNAYTCELSGRAPAVNGLGQLFNITVTEPGLAPIALQIEVLNP